MGSPSVPPFSEPVGKNPAELTAGLSTPLHEYGQYILTCLPKYIQQFSVYKDELTVYTAPTGVLPVLTFLRDHHQCQYKQVMDITAVDYPTKSQRFEVSLCLGLSVLGQAFSPTQNQVMAVLVVPGRLQPPLNRPQLPYQSQDLRR
jgi:NADH dehydrogenase (ubiquinone) Fe-S protein 3